MSENSGAGFLHVEGFKLRILPILLVVVLGLGIPALASITVDIAEQLTHLPQRPQMPWIRFCYEHVAQLAYALLAIAAFKIFLRRDYGLHRPDGKSYLGVALVWGAVFGVLLALAEYWPQILAHAPPADNPYPVTAVNIAGWFSYQGFFAGPSDEVLLRGLLVTVLTAMLPGRIGLGRFEMNVAGVVVALLVAFAYAFELFTKPLLGLGVLFATFVFGVLLAYWFEKSRSLWAPIVGHSMAELVKIALVFAMVQTWTFHA